MFFNHGAPNQDSIGQESNQDNTLSKIISICQSKWPDAELIEFKHSYNTIVTIFRGKHPDFPVNKLPYHNLRHTIAVTLATARLFHGLNASGQAISAAILEKGLICALFHDIALLRTSGSEQVFCKIKVKSTHEVDSAKMLSNFIRHEELSAYLAEECEEIINHTNLLLEPNSIECSAEAKLIGQVIGTADITAQIADRYYTECLSLLYSEMEEENRACEFSSLLDMFEKTENFMTDIENRLTLHFNNIHLRYQDHFREYENLDENLYIESIKKNIIYIKKIVANKDEDINRFLRRTPPCIEDQD